MASQRLSRSNLGKSRDHGIGRFRPPSRCKLSRINGQSAGRHWPMFTYLDLAQNSGLKSLICHWPTPQLASLLYQLQSVSACRANHCAPAYQPTPQIGDLLLTPNLLFLSSFSSPFVTMLFSSFFLFIPDLVVFSQPSRCAASRNPETGVRDARASEFVPFKLSPE